jgi:hypothetical protein
VHRDEEAEFRSSESHGAHGNVIGDKVLGAAGIWARSSVNSSRLTPLKNKAAFEIYSAQDPQIAGEDR